MPDITPLQAQDKAAWRTLAQAYLAFYQTSRPDKDFEQLWLRLQKGDGLHALGARVEGQLVGIVHYLYHPSCWSDDVCYLQDLFVNPEQRSMGLGRALIEAVAEQARLRGSPRLYWLTQASNDTARKLYDQVAAHTGFIRYERPLG
jgi:GNAT superfamily N-acetyltransferase